MNTTILLNKNLSYYETAWARSSLEYTIGEVLNWIKTGRYAESIRLLRDMLRNDKRGDYAAHKKRLACTTFSATFGLSRKKDSLASYNSVFVIDIDKLDAEQLLFAKQALGSDPYVFAYWLSPSHNGIKGLIYVSYLDNVLSIETDVFHKRAFKQIKDHFFTNYKISIDESGSDITRLCFVSYDPDLVIKENVIPFETNYSVSETHIKVFKADQNLRLPKNSLKVYNNERNTLYNPSGRNKPYNRITMSYIIRFLTKKSLSITEDYTSWYRVALAISNSFTYDIGLTYFLKLSQLDAYKFNEENCKQMLLYCYENNKGKINFKTIIYLAQLKGFRVKSKKGGEVLKTELGRAS